MTYLSNHQLEIAQSISDALIYSKSAVLAGLAGSGKTTVAKFLYDSWVSEGCDVHVMAPTGKAALVLRSKNVPATTIHSHIYYYRGTYIDKNGQDQLIFEDNGKKDFNSYFIVDEASMVTAKQREDIEARGVSTLWVGDPGQLPPVNSPPNGLFSESPFILREIHRQAAGNPIIRWAHRLRKGLPLHHPFEGIDHVTCGRSECGFIAETMIRENMDRLIVKTNAQRVALNEAVRRCKGFSGLICPGDEIICCCNNKFLGVINGQIFKVIDVLRSNRIWIEAILEDDFGRRSSFRVACCQFGEMKKITEDVEPGFMLADHAYAVTCHKFQGSSAKHIGILAKGYCQSDVRWNYTAATRAEEKVTVFC